MANKTKELALNFVAQFLEDEGYHLTLESLQLESGEKSFPPMTTKLEEVVDIWESLRDGGGSNDIATVEPRVINDFPCVNRVEQTFQLHQGNPTCVRWHSESAFWSAGVDRELVFHDYITGEEYRSSKLNGPIINITPLNDEECYVPTITGSVYHVKLSAESNSINKVIQQKKFTKNLVLTKDDKFLVLSCQKSISFWSTDSFECVSSIDFPQMVECFTLNSGRDTLLVCLEEVNYIHYISVDSREITNKVNINENGDHHVSFTMISIDVFERDVVVRSNTGLTILLDYDSGERLKVFYDDLVRKANLNYFQVFSKVVQDASHIYAFEERYIWVWSKQGDLKEKLENHEKIVRDMDLDREENKLVSAAFDKKIMLWAPPRDSSI